jgi:hypothetical protein
LFPARRRSGRPGNWNNTMLLAGLFRRVRAAAASLLTLTDEETALLEAWLDEYPEPPQHACSEVERGILSVWEETDPADRDFWTLLRATLKYNRGRTAPAPALPQPAPDEAPSAEQPQAARAEPRPATSETARPTVNLECRTVTLGDRTWDVKSVQALRWLKVLSDHPGEWIAGAALANHDFDLDGARTDRLKKVLPEPVQSLIDSETGKGSRLRLA